MDQIARMKLLSTESLIREDTRYGNRNLMLEAQDVAWVLRTLHAEEEPVFELPGD